MEEESGTDIEALIQRLRLYQPAPSPYAGGNPSAAVPPSPAVAAAGGELFRPRRAAVLVCLFRGGDGELRVLLTKRSSALSTHSGEVALPGGKAEEGDANDAATALREAKEEIGLDSALVTVVASLEHFLSKHLLVVVPVVGILSDVQAFKPVLNVDEVDSIFDVPLEMFLKVGIVILLLSFHFANKRTTQISRHLCDRNYDKLGWHIYDICKLTPK
ncbi:hypothetical protein GUJ93_ZPchr0008g13744 [Zizania palustris]|uniref:Nudix hydrolase domain-containing protein n=1 Tax=Zizania palustris TaxID=103762 RepID=A0A8J5V4K5_ZIZPA|nr:hypothetical protein GUJ93_ZPchr0008g13744 [Zizania palustris]